MPIDNTRKGRVTRAARRATSQAKREGVNLRTDGCTQAEVDSLMQLLEDAIAADVASTKKGRDMTPAAKTTAPKIVLPTPQRRNVFSYCEEAPQRLEVLRRLNKHLKEIYSGIDTPIDRITSLMQQWYVAPGLQTRPCIICLWGMTSCGKTSLVREIAYFLNSELIQIDMGEYADDSGSHDFAGKFSLDYRHHSGKDCMILVDEFQHPRTIHELGGEVDRGSIRGLWSLLSDGLIVPNHSQNRQHYMEQLEEHIAGLEELDAKGKLKPGAKKSGRRSRDDDRDYLTYGSGYGEDGGVASFWSMEYIAEAVGINGYAAERQFKKDYYEDPLEVSRQLMEKVKVMPAQPVLDFTHTVIFVAGNLDEVFSPAHIVDPDVSADDLHEFSLQITLPEVKRSLLRRFRAEQVGRLGNNHVIYPCFREVDFWQIIDRELTRIANRVLTDVGVEMEFEPSVSEMIYREGVFPTQGVRPLLSTIGYLPESMLPQVFVEIVTRNIGGEINSDAPIRVRMRIDDERRVAIFEVLDGEPFTVEYPIVLEVEKHRDVEYTDETIITAVHEAGHAVVALETCGLLPIQVSCKTFGREEGKAVFDMETHLVNEVVPHTSHGLGGWAAEQLIFGRENMSIGVSQDLRSTTQMCWYYASSGMFEEQYPFVRGRNDILTDMSFCAAMVEDLDDKGKDLFKLAMQTATGAVTKHRWLLLKISAALLERRLLDDDDIRQIVEDAGLGHLIKDGEFENGARGIFEAELKEQGISWNPDDVGSKKSRRRRPNLDGATVRPTVEPPKFEESDPVATAPVDPPKPAPVKRAPKASPKAKATPAPKPATAAAKTAPKRTAPKTAAPKRTTTKKTTEPKKASVTKITATTKKTTEKR